MRADIERALALLAANLPGWAPHGTFAVPFGAYGQNGSNDPRIEPWLKSYLTTRFTVVLAGSDAFTTPGPGFARRIRVSPDWNAEALEAHLLGARDRLGAVAIAERPRASSRP